MVSMNPIIEQQGRVTREKAQTWSRSDGDRFIPRRISLSSNDFSLHSYDMSFENRSMRSGGSNLSEHLILGLSDAQTASSNKQFFKYRAKHDNKSAIGMAAESDEGEPTNSIRRKFILPDKPFNILEAPDISDDFYHNIFDWSSKNMLSVCLANTVYMLNADSGVISKLYEAFECESVTSLRWNKTGDQLAVGNVLGQVSIWDINSQKEIMSLDSHEDRVCAIDWQSTIISGSKDSTIVQQDIREKSPHVNTYLGHTEEVCALKWSPDGQYFCSGGNDNNVFVWTPSNLLPVMKGSHDAGVRALAWSERQYGVLASGGGSTDQTIKTWNVRTRELVQERRTSSQICDLVFSKHTNDLISAHGFPGNEINIWRANGLKKVGSITGHTERVLYLRLSPCANTLVSGSGDETLRFWNLYDENFSKGAKQSPGVLEVSNIR